MHTPLEVAIVSSKLSNRQYVAGLLSRLGVDCLSLSTVDQCRRLREQLDLVFCDRDMKDGNYKDLLSALASSSPNRRPKVVMMSDIANSEEYGRLKSQGLFDVISAPSRATDVEWMVILAKRDSRNHTKQPQTSYELSVLQKTASVGA